MRQNGSVVVIHFKEKKEGSMQESSVIGVDISKRIFHFWGVDKCGNFVFRKRVYRSDLMEFVHQLPRVRLVMEACGSAHNWGRRFGELGFEVRLIAPQYVKPFVKTNKNDWADAEAITEAALRPRARFVGVKTVEQQELQHLHRSREMAMKTSTALNNAVRGMLLEYGVELPLGKKAMREVAGILSEERCLIGALGRQVISRSLNQYWQVMQEIEWYDNAIESIARAHPVCKRLQTVPGIGPVIATALVAAVGNPAQYKNGREFSASLGLVPRHTGTGGKVRLLGISKRGDRYLRKQLIHGSRSLLYRAHLKEDKFSRWMTALKAQKGWNKTAVAVANKNARICWHLLRFEKEYDVALVAA